MYNLLNEYEVLLKQKVEIERVLSHIANGYTCSKIIGRKHDSFLKSKVDGKLASKYIKAENIKYVKSRLSLLKQYTVELSTIITRLEALEEAAQLIGKGLVRTLMLLRLSVGMDDLERNEKERCISFANAMNAIEGVSVSQKTAEEISQWQNGHRSFISVFSAVLKRYGFSVEV